ALVRVKLRHLDRENEIRRCLATFYLKNIQNPLIQLPQPPQVPTEHVWHLFVIRCKTRDHLQEYLLQKGIATQIHYPIPPHKQKAYSEWNHLSFPITEAIHQEVLSLPLFPGLSQKEQEAIVSALNEYPGV
ncbi:MAG: aminotransferase, partial [Planctomycetota bacterium]